MPLTQPRKRTRAKRATSTLLPCGCEFSGRLAFDEYRRAEAIHVCPRSTAPRPISQFSVLGTHSITAPKFRNQPSGLVSCIYALAAGDSLVRYIGKTDNPDMRLKQHRDTRNDSNRNLREWIASTGGDFWMHVLCRVQRSRWEEAERAWIAHYRKHGKLYNIEPGGTVTAS